MELFENREEKQSEKQREKNNEPDLIWDERIARHLEFWENKKREMEKQRERQIQRKKKHIEEMREQRERQLREQELDQAIPQLQDEADKLRKEIDVLESTHAQKRTSFDKAMQKIQNTQDGLQEYLETEEGRAIIAEMQECAAQPEKCSDRAQKLNHIFEILSHMESDLCQLSDELHQLKVSAAERKARLDDVLKTINNKANN